MTKHFSNRSRQVLLATPVLAWMALAITGCKKEAASDASAFQRPPAAVTVMPAVAQDVPVYLDEIGKTLAIESVSIVPQVGGKIVAAHVTDGADVKKGQLLFEIDARPFQASRASAQASLLQMKAELDLARIEFGRVEGLINSNAVSQQEFDQKKSSVDVAEAKVKAAEAMLEMETLNVEYTKIYAPTDGRAGALLVYPGNVVKENEQTLLVIQKLDPIYAEFTINENDLGTVRKYIASRGLDLGLNPEKGLKVQVDVPGNSVKVLAALGSGGATTQPTADPQRMDAQGMQSPGQAPTPLDGSTTQPAKPSSTSPATQMADASALAAPSTQPVRRGVGARDGTLVFLDNSVQSTTGTVKLRALLPNEDRYFWPGQFVNVRLVLTVKKNAVLIPVQSQQIGQQGAFVYVVTDGKLPDGSPARVAEIRVITLGQLQGDMIVVESGLAAGDKVITTGQMMVMPGGPVMVTNEGPPQGAQAAMK